ncbi:hypothetical protein GCM10009096_06960 [Parasphingorhabdus litoris]|uniref:Uncharacterized protein n=1 Tax=Parasphingorhabdus litoris TaxID=394733 RepID=A0ABN1A6B1_9SPHN|nr:hypothetical protein [Parasphingorhabdus litoris]
MVAAASRKSVAKHRGDRELRSSSAVQWEKKMSNNCASALLVYTLMQIFFVLSFIQTKGMSIAPYFGLVLLVVVIVPFCRKYEKRWQNVAQSGLSDQSLAARFRKDQVTLWILALGLPFVFVAIIKLIGTIF